MTVNVRAWVGSWQCRVMLALSGVSAPTLLAARPELPQIGPQKGVTKDDDPADILVSIFQWAGGIAIWIVVAWYGLIVFGQVIKAVNEARGGDVGWMEAAKALVGNVIMFIAVLSLALWYSAAFLA